MFLRFDQKSLLRQIAEAQATTFIVKDLEHRFLMVNQLFADAMQLDIEEIIGKTDLEIGVPEHMVLGDPDKGFPGFWALDDKAIASGNSQCNAEVDVSYRKGLQHDASTTRTPLINDANQVVALLVQSRDVSELRDLQNNLQESLNVREDQLSVLNDLMAKMLTYQELDPLLQHIAEIMIQYTLAHDALLLMVSETQEYIQVVASAGSQSKRNIGQRRESGSGFAGLAWSTAETQYIKNSESNPLTKGFWASGTQLLAVPLLMDNCVIGVAVLGAASKIDDFSTSTGLVGSLANLAGIAIASAKSKESTHAELNRTRALSEISKQISQLKQRDELMTSVSKMLMDAMDICRTSSHVIDEAGKLRPFATWHRVNGVVENVERVSAEFLEESISGWCAQHNALAHIPRNTDDPRETKRVHAYRRDMDLGSTLCVSITSDERVVGVLLVNRTQSCRNFNENEINLFSSIASQLSNAVYSNDLSVALQHQAFHDSLTQLPNRRCFEKELKNELDVISSDSDKGAIMFVDLDGFKAVNDSLGHGVGDQLLCHVASRFNSRLQSTDLLARIGGDEFAVIARNLTDQQQAIDMATRLTDSLASAFDISGAKLKIGASIGISFFPDDGTQVDDLLRNADEAMYRAKSDGKSSIVCFNQSMADDSLKRVRLEFELRDAIEQKQFQLYYQPQVDTLTGVVHSVEALIRWHHPVRGLVSPAEFIPAAEEAGIINMIGFWVLDEAIAQLAAWQDTSLRHIRMGVNIASSQFLLENFSDQILAQLTRHSVSPHMLEIEVTESIVMSDVQSVISRLNVLRAAGVRVAIDDFGTGYSSLSYLQDLPLDVLKIDRSFVVRLQDESIENSLVNTIVLLAKGLGLETVAEGVETASQFEQVARLGCNLIQGFYFAKPCAAVDLPVVIDAVKSIFNEAEQQKAA